jgi:hypothetical protein
MRSTQPATRRVKVASTHRERWRGTSSRTWLRFLVMIWVHTCNIDIRPLWTNQYCATNIAVPAIPAGMLIVSVSVSNCIQALPFNITDFSFISPGARRRRIVAAFKPEAGKSICAAMVPVLMCETTENPIRPHFVTAPDTAVVLPSSNHFLGIALPSQSVFDSGSSNTKSQRVMSATTNWAGVQ